MFEYLSEKLSSLFDRFKGEQKLSQEAVTQLINDLRDALIDADIPVSSAEAFLEKIKEKCIGIELKGGITPREMVIKHVYDSLVSFLGGASTSSSDFLVSHLRKNKISHGYQTILVAGLQGAGKTTTISKLVSHLITQEKPHNAKINEKILVASLDYTRAAARDQLKILVDKIRVAYYESSAHNPLSAAEDILSYAQQKGFRYIFFDTAGRLHIDLTLLEELKQVYTLIKPSVSLLVLDGMMGQASLSVAKEFSTVIPFDGAILTKMDSSSRAGAAFSFSFITHKPVVYVGTGEKQTDLEAFKADRIARRLLGMGDIASLVEAANQKIAKAEEDIIQQAIKRGDITIDGYISILNMFDRMGSWKKIMSMIPRSMMPGPVDPQQVDQMERDSRLFRIMSNSMTPKERKIPALLSNQSRRQRISLGSGLPIHDIDRLINHYHKLKEQMKTMGKFSRFFV